MNKDGKSYSVYFYEDDPPMVQDDVGVKDIRVPRSSSSLCTSRGGYVNQKFKNESGEWEIMSVNNSENAFMCKCIGGKDEGVESQYGVGEAILLMRQTEKKSNKTH